MVHQHFYSFLISGEEPPTSPLSHRTASCAVHIRRLSLLSPFPSFLGPNTSCVTGRTITVSAPPLSPFKKKSMEEGGWGLDAYRRRREAFCPTRIYVIKNTQVAGRGGPLSMGEGGGHRERASIIDDELQNKFIFQILVLYPKGGTESVRKE